MVETEIEVWFDEDQLRQGRFGFFHFIRGLAERKLGCAYVEQTHIKRDGKRVYVGYKRKYDLN